MVNSYEQAVLARWRACRQTELLVEWLLVLTLFPLQQPGHEITLKHVAEAVAIANSYCQCRALGMAFIAWRKITLQHVAETAAIANSYCQYRALGMAFIAWQEASCSGLENYCASRDC